MEDKEFEAQLKKNQAAWESLRVQARREYRGKYVAMAFGRIIGGGSTFEEATRLVETMRPAPLHAAVFPAEDEPQFELITDL